MSGPLAEPSDPLALKNDSIFGFVPHRGKGARGGKIDLSLAIA